MAAQALLAQEGGAASDAKASGSVAEAVPKDHKIRVQDRLVYEVKEDPVPPASGQDVARFIVTPLGEVRFPVSRGYGDYVVVKVLNRTIDEVRKDIEEKLEKDYYQAASVYLKLESTMSAETAAQRTGRVFFYGETKGTLPIPPGGKLNLCDALIQLGWSDWAKLNAVKIYRLDAQSGERNTIVFNAEAILKPDKRKPVPPDFELQDEDRVQIEEASFKFFK